jgi:hypothetical protein
MMEILSTNRDLENLLKEELLIHEIEKNTN